MRLFVALHLPPDVSGHLEQQVAAVREAFPRLRWAAAQRWHLTLVFLGEVPDADLPRLRRRYARRLAGRSAMTLSLGGAGRFGRTVLWVGVRGDTDALRRLARRVDPGGRPYQPHLTVARARDRAGTDLRPAVDLLRDYEGPAWPARTVHLVRSYLGPNPHYEDVASWQLGDPTQPDATQPPGSAD